MATLPVDSYSATGKPLWLSASATDFGSPQNILDDVNNPTTVFSTSVTKTAFDREVRMDLDSVPAGVSPIASIQLYDNPGTVERSFVFQFDNTTPPLTITKNLNISAYLPIEIVEPVSGDALLIEADKLYHNSGQSTINFGSNYLGLLNNKVNIQPAGLATTGAGTASTLLTDTGLVFSNAGQVAEIAASGTALAFGVPSATITPELLLSAAQLSSIVPINISNSTRDLNLASSNITFGSTGGQLAEIGADGVSLTFGVPSTAIPQVLLSGLQLETKVPALIGSFFNTDTTTIGNSNVSFYNGTTSNAANIGYDGTSLAVGSDLAVEPGRVTVTNRLNVASINTTTPIYQVISNVHGAWSVVTIGNVMAFWLDTIVLNTTYTTVVFPTSFGNNLYYINGTAYLTPYNGAGAVNIGNKLANSVSLGGGNFAYTIFAIGTV